MSEGTKLSNFLAGAVMQVRAAIEVGVPKEDDSAAHRTDVCGPTFDSSSAERWDDAPGRVTRNGLGSLEIGAGRTRVDE